MVLGLGRQQRTGVRPYTGALGRAYRAPSGNYRQHSLYVGFLTCLLALAAVVFLFAGRRAGRSPVAAGNRREILFFAGAAVLFYLLSLGRNVEPLYRLVFAIPVGDSIRAPVKWHHLTELCLCVLAGFGLDALLRFGVKEAVCRRGRLLWLGGLVLIGAAHLAYMARFYCAAVDLSVVRAPNPAAEAIVQRGGGKVADLLEGGQGLVAWSFAARGLRLGHDAEDAAAQNDGGGVIKSALCADGKSHDREKRKCFGFFCEAGKRGFGGGDQRLGKIEVAKACARQRQRGEREHSCAVLGRLPCGGDGRVTVIRQVSHLPRGGNGGDPDQSVFHKIASEISVAPAPRRP
jgi:hypothetical protein